MTTRVTITLPDDIALDLDGLALIERRSRSAMAALLIERACRPEFTTVTTTSSFTINDPPPNVILDPGYMEAPDRPRCADGTHVRAQAKSGSGMIGCKNCGMVKIGPNWVQP